jgi:hypothetical protein
LVPLKFHASLSFNEVINVVLPSMIRSIGCALNSLKRPPPKKELRKFDVWMSFYFTVSLTCFGHSCGHLQGNENNNTNTIIMFWVVHYTVCIIAHQPGSYSHM